MLGRYPIIAFFLLALAAVAAAFLTVYLWLISWVWGLLFLAAVIAVMVTGGKLKRPRVA